MQKRLFQMKQLLFILFITSSLFAQSSTNDSVIVFSDIDKITPINQNIFILEDTFSNKTIEEVCKSSAFKRSIHKVPNLGVSKSSHWLKFTIHNSTIKKNFLLQLANPLLDTAFLYTKSEDGIYSVIRYGNINSFYNRKYQHQNFIFDVTIPSNTSKTFYLKINAINHVLVPLELGRFKSIFESNSYNDIIVGIFIGILLVMFLYNGFLYLTVKDTSYLYYIIYIFFIGLTQVTILGYTTRLVYPNNVWMTTHGLLIYASLGGISVSLFMYNFLKIKVYAPLHTYCLYLFSALYVCALIAALLNNLQLSYRIIDINAIVFALFIVYTAIKISLKKYQPAYYFLLAWIIFMIGGVFFGLRNLGILEYSNFTNFTMPVGTAIEATLLSMALGARINNLKKEKELSQAEALQASLNHKLIITNQNILLEKKVSERTQALQQANIELSQTVSELKQTQSQLVNSEKMASLGQLTAGIAHEINNPINFVVSNIKPLRRDIYDIYHLIDKYDSIYKNSNTEINSIKTEIDYLHIKNEIDLLLKGLEDGAERTADIVRGLRIFSRLDENDLKQTNITEGIESTLTLLNAEITDAIDVVNEFKILPDIDCYPGKLNQVFMNILNNAIFEIKENTTRIEKGLLQIKTSHNDTSVFIAISDNGGGMKEEVLYKIYEPFFTTKNVGKGTGLGLSIAYSIIEAHHGKIKVESTYGKGSTFTISIPIRYTQQ